MQLIDGFWPVDILIVPEIESQYTALQGPPEDFADSCGVIHPLLARDHQEQSMSRVGEASRAHRKGLARLPNIYNSEKYQLFYYLRTSPWLLECEQVTKNLKYPHFLTISHTVLPLSLSN